VCHWQAVVVEGQEIQAQQGKILAKNQEQHLRRSGLMPNLYEIWMK
jgi:hypothetical protein